MSEASKGKRHSEETRNKLRKLNTGENNGHYGKHHTTEAKQKISAKTSTKVICVETGMIFNSMRETEKITGINKDSISKVCRGIHKTAGGYHWEYYKKE